MRTKEKGKQASRAAAGAELTVLNVDPNNDAAWDELARQHTHTIREQTKREIKDLQAKGIIDANGKRINPDLPPEMCLPSSRPIAE